MADYKLVYENAEKIYGSETGVPAYKEDGTVDTDIDTFIVDRENLEGHKLVYGKKVDDEMVIYVSESGVPAEGDKTIIEVQAEADAEKAKAEKQAQCGVDGGHETVDTDPEDGKCDECEKEIAEDEGGEGGEDDTGDAGDESDPVA